MHLLWWGRVEGTRPSPRAHATAPLSGRLVNPIGWSDSPVRLVKELRQASYCGFEHLRPRPEGSNGLHDTNWFVTIAGGFWRRQFELTFCVSSEPQDTVKASDIVPALEDVGAIAWINDRHGRPIRGWDLEGAFAAQVYNLVRWGRPC